MNSTMAFAIALSSLLQAPGGGTEPVTVRLVSHPKRGGGELRYEGKAVFPDGIVLKATLFRVEERFTQGRLVQESTEVVNEVATVEGKRFGFTVPVKDPGVYRLVIEFREALQEPDLLTSLKKPSPASWSSDHAVWGDDFVGPLSPKLRDFDQQVDTALALIRRFASATATSQVWKDHYPGLDKELAGYLKKLDQSGLEKIYPAATFELRSTMRNLKGNAEAILFGDDGTCKGSIDYRTQKPTKTIHSEDFTFDAILKDVEGSKRAAGGEFLLWLIKDYRRAGARTGLSDALRQEARRPGLSALVEALDGFKDVDETEKQIRSK